MLSSPARQFVSTSDVVDVDDLRDVVVFQDDLLVGDADRIALAFQRRSWCRRRRW
jgi:hypothetical protein